MNMKRDGSGMLEVLLVKGGNKRSWGLPRAFGSQKNPALWIAFGIRADEVERMYEQTTRNEGGPSTHIIEKRVSNGGQHTVMRANSVDASASSMLSDDEAVSFERRKEQSADIQVCVGIMTRTHPSIQLFCSS